MTLIYLRSLGLDGVSISLTIAAMEFARTKWSVPERNGRSQQSADPGTNNNSLQCANFLVGGSRAIPK